MITLAKEGHVAAYAFKKSFEEEGKLPVYADKEVDYEEVVSTKRVSYNSIPMNKGVDLNISDLLSELAREGKIDTSIYESYIDGVFKNAEMPFEITYDLTDIYKSSLSNEEIKNLIKIAKQAHKMNPNVNIKGSIINRALGRIDRRFRPTMDKLKSLIPSKNKELLSEGKNKEENNISDQKKERSFVDTYSFEVQELGKMINDTKDVDSMEALLQASSIFIASLKESDRKYIDNIINNAKENLKREDSIKEIEEKHGIVVEDIEEELPF